MRLVTFSDNTGSTRVGRLDGDSIVVLAAPDMLAWLRGDGHEETGESVAADAATLLAPVPEPPSVRDFFCFEEHVTTGWRLRGGAVPAEWYEIPVAGIASPHHRRAAMAMAMAMGHFFFFFFFFFF